VRSPAGDPAPLVGAKQRHACDGVAESWGPIVGAPRRQLRKPQIGCGWGPHVGANLVLCCTEMWSWATSEQFQPKSNLAFLFLFYFFSLSFFMSNAQPEIQHEMHKLFGLSFVN
jgi:hypothetical protein